MSAAGWPGTFPAARRSRCAHRLRWTSGSMSSRRTTGHGSFAMAPQLVATGRPASLELTLLETASFDEASAAELLTPIKPHEHPLPTCFVCGPARAQGDGLRIFAGPLERHSRNASAVSRGDLDTGSEPGGGGRPDRIRISLVGARLSHRLCFLSRPRERQLRPDADPVGPDVGTDRGPAAPGRTLRHHRLGDRPRRPQTRCRGRGLW